MSRKWVRRHGCVKEYLDSCDCSCVKISDLAKNLQIDPRTARAHLEVMQVDRVGAFTDEEKTVFCRPEAIERIGERLIELAREMKRKEG